ncbi:MAG: hypothetical protein JEZ00_01135 [Anaerolineaceae bacterium]|nr:hypothetical protein [Anaerolineaceae bacterium]
MESSNKQNEKEQTENSTPAADRDIVDSILHWMAAIVGILCLLLIAWLYRPWIYDWVTPDPTVTPTVATSTPMNTTTPAPTRTPEPSITPTPSPIPLPTSIYHWPEHETIDPLPPGFVSEPIILNESNALVSPDLSNPQWIPSSQISSQLGYNFSEEYHATFGPGAITWQMDTALPAGYYEIFILDTVFSSAGTLDFQVKSGDTPLAALTDTQRVLYRSSQGETAQAQDMWQSIGVYQVPENNLLAISTQWEARDEYTIVAIDRVLISHLPDDTGELLQTLPQSLGTYILDDEGAKIESDTYPVALTDNRSWGAKSTVLINPNYQTKVTWEYPDLIPLGTYEIAVFVPELNGNAEVNYQLYANGQLISHDQLEESISVVQSQYQGGWFSLGEWTVPLYFSYPVELKLEMGVNEDSLGEVAVDAAAFILKSMPEILPQ